MLTVNERCSHLLDARNLGGHPHVRWLGNRMLGEWLGAAGAQVAQRSINTDLPVSTLVYARRMVHPARLAFRRGDPVVMVERIMRSLQSIEAQAYPTERVAPPVVLIDDTLPMSARAKKTLEQQAHVVSIDHHANHAKALNDGIAELRQGKRGLALILDAGSHYATDQAFRAAAEAIQAGALAAFGSHLADGNASRTQSLGRILRSLSYSDSSESQTAPIDRPSLIPADGMAYDVRLLPDRPFDPVFGRGGANHELLRQKHQNGEVIRYLPALSVQSGELIMGPLALVSAAAEAARMRESTIY